MLPWQSQSSDIDIDVLYDNLLNQYPGEMDKRLRAEANDLKLINRLVFQFSDKRIETLIRKIQSSESELVIQSAQEQIELKGPIEESNMEPGNTNMMYINNAGLVLLSPFIPTLFEKAGLIANEAFRNQDKQFYAVHLLQYMIANDLNSPEYLLVLPKILCGLDINEPMQRSVSLTDSDLELSDSLLSVVISRWEILGETSTEGLQQSFLARSGVLREGEERWELEVEVKSFDMLLDQIPWRYELIHYPWMNKPLSTQWR